MNKISLQACKEAIKTDFDTMDNAEVFEVFKILHTVVDSARAFMAAYDDDTGLVGNAYFVHRAAAADALRDSLTKVSD